MDKIKLEFLINDIEDQQRQLVVVKEIIKKIENYFNENGIKFHCWLNSYGKLIIDGKPKDLTKIRKMLREIFGEWKDYIFNIFESCGVYLSYCSKDKDVKKLITIHIRYENESELPKSITKDGKCGFKEETVKITNWVCNMEVEND